MAQATISGNEVISDLGISVAEEFPFGSYLLVGSFPNEDWNSVNYDPNSTRTALSFKSVEGSTLTFNETRTGSEESSTGSNAGSVVAKGKIDGTSFSGTWADSWSETGSRFSNNITWTYTGGTKSKDDDFNYKWSNTTVFNKSGSWTETQNLEYSSASYLFKQRASASGNDAGYNMNMTYSFKDIENNASLSFTINAKADIQKDEVAVNLSGIKYLLADYSVTTAKYAGILTYAEWDSLPSVTEDAGSFSNISANIVDLQSIFMAGDNTIAISSSSGVEIDAGAGNDKITGGKGDDTIIAGAGKDTITGGKGNDTFILRVSDYDFTSAKTVLQDSISGFTFKAGGEQDELVLDGFGEVAVFNKLAAAQLAGSSAEVIYEKSTGKLWYNQGGDGDFSDALAFATIRGIPDNYWVSAGFLS